MGEKRTKVTCISQLSLELSLQGKRPWHSSPKLACAFHDFWLCHLPLGNSDYVWISIPLHLTGNSTANSRVWPHILHLSYKTSADTSAGISSHSQCLGNCSVDPRANTCHPSDNMGKQDGLSFHHSVTPQTSIKSSYLNWAGQPDASNLVGRSF